MKEQNEFFESFTKRYIPHELRGMFVAAYGQEKPFRMNFMERPTMIERLIEKDKLQGIEIERTALDVRGNYEYSAIISPSAFLSNIDRYTMSV